MAGLTLRHGCHQRCRRLEVEKVSGHETFRYERIGSAKSVLVVAPHPDDEILAAGGLLQTVREAGASVNVLLLTDGDNNPWPQRWLEKRLRINTHDRRRWAQRRRSESALALTRLGFSESVQTALGWPDLGITDRLLDDPQAILQPIRSLLSTWQPDLLVLPTLDDHHPDHSAARIVFELAMATMPVANRPTLLGYCVHGPHSSGGELRLPAEQAANKAYALEAHTSQLALSGGRLRRLLGRTEHFVEALPPPPAPVAARLLLPWRPWPWLGHSCELLVLSDPRTWRLPLIDQVQEGSLRLSITAEGLILHFDKRLPSPLFVKIRSRISTPWIYDSWNWISADDAARLTAAADSSSLAQAGTE